MNALYLYLAGLAACMVAGGTWFCMGRGTRIVSGRVWARATYVSLVVGLVLAAMVLHVIRWMYPTLAAQPEVRRALWPILVAVPAAVVVGIVYVWLHARSLSRSIIFYKVRRDELGPVVARTLTQLQVPFAHRLRTLRDEFVLPDGARIIVHGGAPVSWLELPGRRLDAARQTAIAEAVVREVKSALAAAGRDIVDRRPRRAVAA